MTRKLLGLVAVLVATLGLTMINTGNASALGGEWLGCQVGPGSDGTYSQRCRNSGPTINGWYQVDLAVQNETAPSTYSWSLPVGYQSSVLSGCTSTSSSCSLLVPSSDQRFDVSVTLTQGGASSTLTASVSIMEYCWYGQWQLC
jgi:hypothetical protein